MACLLGVNVPTWFSVIIHLLFITIFSVYFYWIKLLLMLALWCLPFWMLILHRCIILIYSLFGQFYSCVAAERVGDSICGSEKGWGQHMWQRKGLGTAYVAAERLGDSICGSGKGWGQHMWQRKGLGTAYVAAERVGNSICGSGKGWGQHMWQRKGLGTAYVAAERVGDSICGSGKGWGQHMWQRKGLGTAYLLA